MVKKKVTAKKKKEPQKKAALPRKKKVTAKSKKTGKATKAVKATGKSLAKSKVKAKKTKSEVDKSKSKSTRRPNNKFFPIVGIGASAGGLEALEGFFTKMPPQSNLAIVVIQHLAPKYKSIMGSLLNKYTSMKIVEMKDYMKVEPNCVYLNPPNKDVAIMNGKLHLMKPVEAHSVRLPIDYFFRSLSEDQGEIAICIILSGTGTDGTLGLKAIKGAGGMTMVQSENQAKYDSMPRSAIDTGLVDFIIPVEKMPNELMKYVKHPYIEKPVKAVTARQQYRNNVAKILMMIRTSTGNDFSYYKENTVYRRIERRMAVHQIERIGEYVTYLRSTPAEIDTLYKDMLIGVTNFFRDPDAFEVLKEKVLTVIFKNKLPDSTVRIWIPGCATGEEAFSIAMTVVEIMEKTKKHFNVQIFGTDIDADAIEFARTGSYPDSIAADVTPKRLKRFFVKEDNTYRIKKQIREMTVFAIQNIIKDPPFSKLDLVSCRNLLIYMDTVLQKKVLPLIHYTLNQDGFLFLGSSETTGEYVNLFSTVNTKWKIYRRKPSAIDKGVGYPIVTFSEKIEDLHRGEIGKAVREVNVRQQAERIILESFGPPCVLINDKHEIIYFHGKTDVYLSPPSGEPSFDILKMVREELRYGLTTILHRMIKQKQEKPVNTGELKLKNNGNYLTVEITIKPILEPKALAGMMMVIFKDKTPEIKGARKKKVTAVIEKKEDAHVSSLKQELRSTKEYLQTTIEELETSNEELKSTNEELQSTNEELQSTNEELETSKEEQQSTNEELETVNAELQNKVDELSRSNNDLNNLLASTEIATVFLDTNLRIVRFTPSATRIFNLIKSDIKRPISDITAKFDCNNLRKETKKVLDTLMLREIEIETDDGNWFTMRILPYRTIENVIEGVVITFMDITGIKKAEEQVINLAKFPSENPNPVLRISKNGIVIYANQSSKPLLEDWKIKTGESLPRNLRRTFTSDYKSQITREIEIKSGNKVFSLLITPVSGTDYSNVYGRDITERKKAEEKYQRDINDLKKQLVRIKGNKK